MTIDLLEAKNITDNFLRKNKIDWLFEDPEFRESVRLIFLSSSSRCGFLDALSQFTFRMLKSDGEQLAQKITLERIKKLRRDVYETIKQKMLNKWG